MTVSTWGFVGILQLSLASSSPSIEDVLSFIGRPGLSEAKQEEVSREVASAPLEQVNYKVCP